VVDDIRALSEPLIEWVYDNTKDGPTGGVSITEFTEAQGLDGPQAFQLLYYTQERGMVDAGGSTMGVPEASLTHYGHEWVEQRRGRRSNPAERAKFARNSLLAWLWRCKQAGTSPALVRGILTVPLSLFEGERLAEDEFERAAAYLLEKKLITGGSKAGSYGPIYADVTAMGEDCVENYEADVSAFGRRTIAGTVINIGHNSGNIAANSREVTQSASTTAGLNAADVILTARALRQAVPVLGLQEEDAREFTDVATRMETEASAAALDTGRLQRWSVFLVSLLNSPAVGGALGPVLAQQLESLFPRP
jgi:hypothetical protein